ncbi:MAG: hypothetical protein AUI33_13820 [Ignavibacteria bacterium 13_1_40CM_2_61_4]|nr:MAG: hypothetical protein AUI33_13820 [Ignavibacteria bacterium 13_1_40CM_2_61_4]
MTEASPRLKARIAGGLWLMVIAGSVSAFVLGSPLIVPGDAAATATNILASESLFRLAFAANLIAGVCYMGVTVLLYGLLKPVSRTISLLAAFFGLAGVAIGSATSLTNLAILVLLGDGQYSSAFTTSQLQAMALMSLRLYLQGFNISMVFFGFQCFLIGYLIVRSTFLPRILGVLLAIGGASYVISSFATFLSPAFGARLAPFILPAALLGEGSLTLWLLVIGVNVQRWQEQASAAGASIRT